MILRKHNKKHLKKVVSKYKFVNSWQSKTKTAQIWLG